MAKEPSEMSDEELNLAAGGETTPEEAPPKEETKVEAKEPEPEVPEAKAPQESEAEETPVEEEKPPSRRESLRIQQLVDKLKEKPVQAEPKVEGLDYGTALDADPEVIKQLEDDRTAASQSSFNQGIEQAKSIQFHTRLEIDAPKIESKYPLFDKDSEDFNPDVSNAINSWYLATVGYDQASDRVGNPNIRYADFVESMMELVDRTAGAKVEKTTANIAKQAAQTGVRPDGSSTKLNLNKAPEDMTDEELYAVLGQTPPNKK